MWISTGDLNPERGAASKRKEAIVKIFTPNFENLDELENFLEKVTYTNDFKKQPK